jgi:hypothetical protein
MAVLRHDPIDQLCGNVILDDVDPMKGERVQVEVIAGTFALAIPFMAIAQVTAHGFGVAFVMLGVVAVNLRYFIDRWVRMS